MTRRAHDLTQYDWLSIEPNGHGGFTVYGHGTYEETSVLAGCPLRQYLDGFDSIEEAQAKYPTAEVKEWSTRGYLPSYLPHTAPAWFNEADAGERWDDDY